MLFHVPRVVGYNEYTQSDRQKGVLFYVDREKEATSKVRLIKLRRILRQGAFSKPSAKPDSSNPPVQAFQKKDAQTQYFPMAQPSVMRSNNLGYIYQLPEASILYAKEEL